MGRFEPMTLSSSVQRPLREPRSKAAAYGLLLIGLLGFCGLQRLYVGKIGSGLLYLFTLGLCGVGQFVDLFLLPEMVDDYNHRKGRGRYAVPAAQQQVVINIGEQITTALDDLGLERQNGPRYRPASPMVSLDQTILQRCHDSSASIGQICIAAGHDVREVKEAVDRLVAEGLLRAFIDDNGTIRYSLA